MENWQHFRCEGKIPKEMKDFVLKPKPTETGWEGMCTHASQLRPSSGSLYPRDAGRNHVGAGSDV